MARTVGKVEVLRLRLPLTKPYRLSFGTQYHFDTILVILTDDTGREGFGEATLLHGYTDETVEQSWATGNALAPILKGMSLEQACSELEQHVPASAFTATAFLTALDMLQNHPALATGEEVELLAILSSDGSDAGAAREEIDAHIAQGYGTLKFKVGFDVEKDLAALRTVQKANVGRARLRVDANQGFSPEDAIAFLKAMDPADIELLEQPCHKDDWAAAAAVRPHARVPLMLDESIYGIEDIDRTADEGLADYVKLKLMKLGGLSALTHALDRIAERGMQPVLGNGVAGDIGCWMEACAMKGHVDNAGEMNGFLKTPVQLLDPPLRMDGARVVLPDAMPSLNRDAITDVCEETRIY